MRAGKFRNTGKNIFAVYGARFARAEVQILRSQINPPMPKVFKLLDEKWPKGGHAEGGLALRRPLRKTYSFA